MTEGDLPGTDEDGPRLRLEELLTQLVDRAQEALGTQRRLRVLVGAQQSVVGDLELPVVLRRIVEAACRLVDARYGALGVIDPDGSGLEEFIFVGMDEALVSRIGHLPQGKGLLGALIDDPHPIRLDDLGRDARSAGFPEGHPPMESFLGVPVRVREEVFGNLYLAGATAGSFTEDDQALVTSLAASAGVAIENARLFEESRHRQAWLQASAEVTRRVLSAADATPLEEIVEVVRRLADADLVRLLVPDSTGARLSVAAAAGDAADQLVDESFPVAGALSETVLATGEPALLEDVSGSGGQAGTGRPLDAETDPLLQTGPAMLVPLVGSEGPRGVLLTGRRPGRRRFSSGDLEMATTFASHASMALELADARVDQQRMQLLEERERIARDLHDHVIQQLFAAGMTVRAAVTGLEDPARAGLLEKVVDSLDVAVKQIRTSIFQLRPHASAAASIRAAVLEVTAEAARALGFEPHVLFEGPVDTATAADLAEDVLAVVREGLSNVAKHARASVATVRLRAVGGELQVTIADDGIGLPDSPRRSGLANLRDRAGRRAGRLEIDAPDPGGTRLTWTVPLG